MSTADSDPNIVGGQFRPSIGRPREFQSAPAIGLAAIGSFGRRCAHHARPRVNYACLARRPGSPKGGAARAVSREEYIALSAHFRDHSNGRVRYEIPESCEI